MGISRCTRCRQRRCLCDLIVPLSLRTRFTIVRHYAERPKVSNTGHFAMLAIPGSRLLEWGALPPLDETQLPTGEGTYVLYPDRTATPPPTPPRNIIVLDATWAQARRMRHRIRALRDLPSWTLPPPDLSRLRLRRPHARGVSTLEAIAQVVATLESAEQAATLERLYDALVQERLRKE